MHNFKYQPDKIEIKWQRFWKKKNLYKANIQRENPFYLLVELTYTSGDLHMGHWFAWTAPDIYARFKRMQGENVLFPVGGFDAFGLPAENAAIKHGIHPRQWTYKNIERMRKQFLTTGASFDWDKEVITCDTEYYRWTQWLFLQLYKNGLAYRDKVWSNWCPECKTVLANENVENGRCWRHTKTFVEQKLVDQWLFRITKYADRLIWPKNPSVDWPQAAIEGQNNWIGRSEGVTIRFKIDNRFQREDSKFEIEVFTTRPETIFGATFLVLAPEHPLVFKIISPSKRSEVERYVNASLKKLERVRLEDTKTKTGVFTGSFAVNPLSGESIPVWVADFVLGSYGKGAIMGVPAHDSRDWEFAKQMNLVIKRVIKSGKNIKGVYEGEGKLINSGEFNNLDSKTARKKISEYIVNNHLGERSVQYHLRDWTISRQRYWGAPIPIIYCRSCWESQKAKFTAAEKVPYRLVKSRKLQEGIDYTVIDGKKYMIHPVPEKDLPVRLPENVDYTPTGKPPLASADEWVKVPCPVCGKEARREVETMDTYVDSSWYFFRYLTPHYKKGPFDKKIVNKWMPIKLYFGGPEHILGHTLYARFITKFLYDLGYIRFDEFALKRFHHGVILGPDGYRMSKSRGNVVNPDEQVKKFGADAVRVYIAFLGPHDKGGSWKTEGIEGSYRFLNRVWKIFVEKRNIFVSKEDAKRLYSLMHKTIQKVTYDIERLQTNTALAAIMEYVNLLRTIANKNSNSKVGGQGLKIRCAEWDEALKTLLLLLAPFAPHITEELFQRFFRPKTENQKSKFNSIHFEPWPKYIPELVLEEEVTIAVQVNGKLRGTINVNSQISEVKNRVVELARKDPKIAKWLEGKTIKDIIFVANKIVNFVTT